MGSLSVQVFTILSGLVAEHAGLHFDLSRMSLFADKVEERAAEAGFESMLDYYYYLRYDPRGPDELDALVESLVVGETYLFRELGPLETMVSELVVPKVAAGGRPRIWCAASSTGEEPHTVAMLLASRGLLQDVELLASDINTGALERAQSGQLSRRAIRQEVPAFARPWLEESPQGFRVRRGLTQAIDWRRVNLLDEAAVASLGTFDVILCRNVLIYFSDSTIRRVVDSLHGRLNPGGALFVGISESLLRFGGALVCEERAGNFLYRRPA